MKVLVDTSVWSLALRRPASRLNEEERALVAELRGLITDGRVLMVGVVRQELLSGIKDKDAFDSLRSRLRPFVDEPLTTADFEDAASIHNTCRGVGVAGSTVDFLLCAVSISRGASIFTTDPDFRHYGKAIRLRMHAPAT